MDIQTILKELAAEREQIEGAIISLERLARGHAGRRGRPPGSKNAPAAGPKRRGRPPGSKNKKSKPA